MAAEKGLAMIFGEPKGEKSSMGDTEPAESTDYPPGFEDACEAAFDAIRSKDSKGFCSAMLDALTAFDTPDDAADIENSGAELDGED